MLAARQLHSNFMSAARACDVVSLQQEILCLELGSAHSASFQTFIWSVSYTVCQVYCCSMLFVKAPSVTPSDAAATCHVTVASCVPCRTALRGC